MNKKNIYLFIVYLMSLSVAEIIWRRELKKKNEETGGKKESEEQKKWRQL
jgi:hypothetical protein